MAGGASLEPRQRLVVKNRHNFYKKCQSYTRHNHHCVRILLGLHDTLAILAAHEPQYGVVFNIVSNNDLKYVPVVLPTGASPRSHVSQRLGRGVGERICSITLQAA